MSQHVEQDAFSDGVIVGFMTIEASLDIELAKKNSSIALGGTNFCGDDVFGFSAPQNRV